MEILNTVFTFVSNNILTKAEFFVGLIVLVGYILLGRKWYETLAGCLFEKPAYRKAMNSGLAVTETRYKGLNERADELIQALIDKIGEE